jgi:hypothetical protein
MKSFLSPTSGALTALLALLATLSMSPVAQAQLSLDQPIRPAVSRSHADQDLAALKKSAGDSAFQAAVANGDAKAAKRIAVRNGASSAILLVVPKWDSTGATDFLNGPAGGCPPGVAIGTRHLYHPIEYWITYCMIWTKDEIVTPL